MYRQNILGIIFDEEGKILLGKYNSSNPNWTFPKGGVENGETLETALWRELYEELGINNKALEIVYVYEKDFVKNFSKEEIDWKIKNKGEYYIGKREKIFVLHFLGKISDINLEISNEFSEFTFVEITYIYKYILDAELIKFINIEFLKEKIKIL